MLNFLQRNMFTVIICLGAIFIVHKYTHPRTILEEVIPMKNYSLKHLVIEDVATIIYLRKDTLTAPVIEYKGQFFTLDTLDNY